MEVCLFVGSRIHAWFRLFILRNFSYFPEKMEDIYGPGGKRRPAVEIRLSCLVQHDQGAIRAILCVTPKYIVAQSAVS